MLEGCSNFPLDYCTAGTSFAAPTVAGGVARYLQNHPNAGWVEIMNYFAAEAAANNNGFVLEPSGARKMIFGITD